MNDDGTGENWILLILTNTEFFAWKSLQQGKTLSNWTEAKTHWEQLILSVVIHLSSSVPYQHHIRFYYYFFFKEMQFWGQSVPGHLNGEMVPGFQSAADVKQ